MSPSAIKDRFAKVEDHRVRYRLRMRAKRRCIACGAKSKAWRCKECAEHTNQLARERRAKKRMIKNDGNFLHKPGLTGNSLRKALENLETKKG